MKILMGDSLRSSQLILIDKVLGNHAVIHVIKRIRMVAPLRTDVYLVKITLPRYSYTNDVVGWRLYNMTM